MKNLTPPITSWATWFDRRGCHVAYWSFESEEAQAKASPDHTKADMVHSVSPLQMLDLSMMLQHCAISALNRGMPPVLRAEAPEPYPEGARGSGDYTLPPPTHVRAEGVPQEAQEKFEEWVNKYWSEPSSDHETSSEDPNHITRLKQRTRRKAKPGEAALRRLLRGNG